MTALALLFIVEATYCSDIRDVDSTAPELFNRVLPYVRGMRVLQTPPSTKNTANIVFHARPVGRLYGVPTTILAAEKRLRNG